MLAFIALAFLGCVGAQTPATTGCCVSNKFTATLLQLSATLAKGSSTPTINDGYVLLDYDYGQNMSKLNMHTLDQVTGNYSNIIILNDYTNDKTYTEVKGQCYVAPIAIPMTPPCIPATFNYSRTYRLGAGAAALSVDIWTGTVQGQRVISHIVPGSCTPVAQSTYGDTAGGTREMTSFLFANVEQNQLSSTDTFVLSDLCKTSAVPTGRKRSLITSFI